MYRADTTASLTLLLFQELPTPTPEKIHIISEDVWFTEKKTIKFTVLNTKPKTLLNQSKRSNTQENKAGVRDNNLRKTLSRRTTYRLVCYLVTDQLQLTRSCDREHSSCHYSSIHGVQNQIYEL